MNKTIHYIWLGHKKKPAIVRKCIQSWKTHLPGWEIKEWNESNLNLDICPFCREAYDARRYAFAADVLRFDILYREGGLYFDIDVKVIKDFEELTARYDAFVGYEFGMVNPGLVLYAKEPKNPIIGEMLKVYQNTRFLVNGQENHKVVGAYFSEILEKHGFVYEDRFQQCDGFTVLPCTYFCPTDGYGNRYNFSENTYSVHLFAGSWLPFSKRCVRAFKRTCYRLFGMENIQRVMRRIRRIGNQK